MIKRMASSVNLMSGLLSKSFRAPISVLIFTCLLFSSFSAVPLHADADQSDIRTYLTLDAGLIPSYDSSISRITNNGWYGCTPQPSSVTPLAMLIAECLENPNLDLGIVNSLVPCIPDVSIPCIEDVFARNPSTDWLRGSFFRYLDNDRFGRFGALPQYEIGEQHDRNLYTFPGLTDDPGQLFAIQPLLSTKIVRKVLFGAENLKVALHAVKKTAAKAINNQHPLRYSSSDEYEKSLLTCTYLINRDGCWDYASNPLTNQFKIVLRLSLVPSGWLMGRLYSPDIKIESIPGAAQPYRVTLIGGAVPTPGITKAYFSDDPEDRATCDKISQVKNKSENYKCFESNHRTSVFYSNIAEYENLKNKIPELDVATKIVDEWQISMGFLDKKSRSSQTGCAKSNPFFGFVSSNALTYDEVPTFDATFNSLDYMVGGPHYMPDKSVFSGLYSMIISREYVKCIWGLSRPVFNASVQVVDQDGVVSTAVTTIGIDDQFVRFSATGFTFSKKIMKVKFFKTKKELDQSKKKIITCVKNQKVVRFVGVASCPKGFKIKK